MVTQIKTGGSGELMQLAVALAQLQEQRQRAQKEQGQFELALEEKRAEREEAKADKEFQRQESKRLEKMKRKQELIKDYISLDSENPKHRKVMKVIEDELLRDYGVDLSGKTPQEVKKSIADQGGLLNLAGEFSEWGLRNVIGNRATDALAQHMSESMLLREDALPYPSSRPLRKPAVSGSDVERLVAESEAITGMPVTRRRGGLPPVGGDEVAQLLAESRRGLPPEEELGQLALKKIFK